MYGTKTWPFARTVFSQSCHLRFAFSWDCIDRLVSAASFSVAQADVFGTGRSPIQEQVSAFLVRTGTRRILRAMMHLIDSTQQMSEFIDPIRLAGFNSSADVFSFDGRVIQGFRRGKGELSRQVFETCTHYRLFQHGIVETHELTQLPWNGVNYDLILEHERIPFISYPHEWSPTMLQDAATLHVDLFMRLAPFNFTIKDWHPYNILFKGPCPVFVDFASLLFHSIFCGPKNTEIRPVLRIGWPRSGTLMQCTFMKCITACVCLISCCRSTLWSKDNTNGRGCAWSKRH